MDFHRPSSTVHSLDRKPSTFSFDDNAGLESSILDTPTLMSPTTSTQGIFSPDTSLWDDSSFGQFVDRTATSSVVNQNGNNPFFTEQSNNPFARLPANQAATYGQQTSWPPADNTGVRTPTANKPMNPFVGGDFEPAQSAFVAQQIPFHGMPVHGNVRPSSVFPPAPPEQPLSPHNNSEWMAFNQQEMDARPGPKRMRPNSPHRSYSPRRDGGIRKKNARFEIPAERNLFNIDQLIANCTNEDEMKELKQQKRLLRNRQAAYVPILVLVSYLVSLSRPLANVVTVLTRGSERRSTPRSSRKRRRLGTTGINRSKKTSTASRWSTPPSFKRRSPGTSSSIR